LSDSAVAEWRQFVLLARNFWRRFFESELLSGQAEVGLGIPHILALVAGPGVVLPFLLKLKYIGLAALPEKVVQPYTWDDKLFLVAYSMAIIGLLTVVVWDSLLPDKRDFSILSPFPIRLRTICLAKLAAVMFFPAVFLLAVVHLSPLLTAAILLPVPTMTEPGKYAAAHAVSVLAAGIFAFSCVAALHALLVNLLGYRLFRRVSGYVQFSFAWLILSSTTLYPRTLPGFDPSHPLSTSFPLLFPPMWFLGLFEVLMGRSEPAFRQLAALSMYSLTLVTGVALVGTLLVFEEQSESLCTLNLSRT
jgi:hypothetical protein